MNAWSSEVAAEPVFHHSENYERIDTPISGDGGRWLPHKSFPLCVSAAIAMMMYPGVIMSLYLASVGFYSYHFHSRGFLIGMLVAMELPSPIIWVLQQRFDAHFEKRYSTRDVFFFRVILMQPIMACIVAMWMLMPQYPWNVLGIGFLLGTGVSGNLSACYQLVAALNPDITVYAQLGQMAGGTLPVLVFSFYNFKPSSSLEEFRTVISSAFLICIFTCSLLCVMHFHVGLFNKAYARLSYDLDDFEDDGLDRQLTDTTPLGIESGGIPYWVWMWCFCSFVMRVMAMSLECLTSWFGAESMAQQLVLLLLLASFAGRVMGLPIRGLACFEQGPWHKTIAGCLCLVIVCVVLAVGKIVGLPVSKMTLLIVWCIVFMIDCWLGVLIQMTITLYVAVKDRRVVSRTNLGSGFLGTFAGICIVSFVVVPMLKLGTNWPAFDYRIT